MRQIGTRYFTDQAADIIEARKQCGQSVMLALPEMAINTCPNCEGSGHMIVRVECNDEDARTIYFSDGKTHHVRTWTFCCPMCNDDTADRMSILWEQCGLEPIERDWHIDYIKGMIGKENAFKAAGEILSTSPFPTGWVTFYGSYGVGKTGILKSLVAGFVRASVSARYVLAADILADFRSTYDKDSSDNEAELFRKYTGVRVLAIDEIGTDRISNTQWAQSTLMRLINARYSTRDSNATIFATNDDPARMSESLGYLADRMRDGQRKFVGGDSLRGRR